MTHHALTPQGKAIAQEILTEVHQQVEAAVAPFRHLELVRVSQYVSDIMGRPKLRPSVEVTLSGYAPSLHAATTSLRIPLAAIERNGVPETIDSEMQKQITLHEGRRRLALSTFGHEVAPLPRNLIGHLTTSSLDIDILVELEGDPERVVRRIARGVDTIISRREAGDHKATSPFSLQTMNYREMIRLGGMVVHYGAILIPQMIDGLKTGQRIGDHVDLPKALAEAKIKLIRDERNRTESWSSRRIVVGLDLDPKQVQIGPYLKEQHGYEIPKNPVSTISTKTLPRAHGDTVELAIAVMDWWDGEGRGSEPPYQHSSISRSASSAGEPAPMRLGGKQR